MTTIELPKPQYRNSWYTIVPEWLTTRNAEQYMFTLETMRDALVEKATQAIAIRFPGQGDPSQLPYLAHDKALDQGPSEPDASFVKRLQTAPASWKRAGSAVSVLEQLQAYLQGLQPGVAATMPEMAIVLDTSAAFTKWVTLYQGDAIGASPTFFTASGSNFDWDGQHLPWRAWLVLYMSLVQVSSGTGASTTTAAGGSFTNPGQNVNGVWVPATSGTPVNAPFLTVTGLSGMNSTNVGMWLTLSGSGHHANNGRFPITAIVDAATVVVSNPSGVTADAGPLTWSVGKYPFIGPGPVWGAPGVVFGEGEGSLTPPTIPPLDTGSIVGGVWQPTTPGTYGCTTSWGLTCSSTLIGAIRSIVKKRKSAGTYYPNFVITFDNGTGAAGSEYSPNSTPGAGNPDGSFGSVGQNVAGVWVPTRYITGSFSPPSNFGDFDAYCQGTGSHINCSIENVT